MKIDNFLALPYNNVRILVLIAHPDDELVGLFYFLKTKKYVKDVILYNPLEHIGEDRIKELKLSADTFKYKPIIARNLNELYEILTHEIQKNEINIIAVPDLSENHVAHKTIASIGISIFSELSKLSSNRIYLLFYSIDMNSSFTFPLPRKIAEEKRAALMNIYRSQHDLWEKEGKYWLFEGYALLLNSLIEGDKSG